MGMDKNHRIKWNKSCCLTACWCSHLRRLFNFYIHIPQPGELDIIANPEAMAEHSCITPTNYSSSHEISQLILTRLHTPIFLDRLLIESRRKRRLAEARLKVLVEQRRKGIQAMILAVLLLTASRKITAARQGMKAKRTC